MKTSTTNWLLFFAFAIACGTAYHYKTQAAYAQVKGVPKTSQAIELASNPKLPEQPIRLREPSAEPRSPTPPPTVNHSHNDSATSHATSTPEDGVKLKKAQALLRSGKIKAGIYLLESLVFDSAGTVEAATAKNTMAKMAAKYSAEAKAYEKRGDLLKARQNYTFCFFATAEQQDRDAIVEHVGGINDKLLRTKKAGAGIEYHKVSPGESLAVIAKRYGMNWMTLQRMNRLKSHNIRVGQRLKIMTGKMSIDICKSRFELVLLMDGQLFKRFYVATGKDDRTPEGQFTIEERIIEPTWYGPDGVYKFGHEKHILGTRWLGFNRTDEIDGFGIHGTKFPESIGSEASMGCIRMRNQEVEVVFDYTPRKCVVSIR